MFKSIGFMLIGVFVAGLVTAALAVVGQPPLPATGLGLVDGTWLNGLAGGSNWSYQYGFTAVGTAQASALQLPANIHLLEVDTSGSGGGTGVALPTCVAGTEIMLSNNTAYTFVVYPSIANNPLTAAQDKINNSTSTTITTYSKKILTCAQNGVWIS